MKNVTLAIEDEVLDRARSYAARNGTTLNALVRQHLEILADDEGRLTEAMRELRAISEQTQVSLGPDYKFRREDAYEDRMFPRHERLDLRSAGKK
jgi:hypothetical protein